VRLAPAAAALTLALALAAPAGAQIVVGRSIHGVRPTDTEARFRALLGAPDGPRAFGDEPSDYGLDFRGGRYHGLFATKSHRGFYVSTTSSSQRTASGVGPGVSARFARARLHGERCGRIFDADRGIDVTQCAIRRRGTETDFAISFGRVFEVAIDASGARR